jgi:hypothetical protein
MDHDSLTSALVAGDWCASRPGRFTLASRSLVSNGQEDGWAAEPVWMIRQILYLTETRTPILRSSDLQPVAIPAALPLFIGGW